MAEITVALISKLRQQTSAGMMDCKKALTESDGDFDSAVEWLRKKGDATSAKKASRATSEGVIARHLTEDGKGGTLVEINCETDFVAKNDGFQTFCEETTEALHADSNADLEESRKAIVASLGENIRIARSESLTLDGDGAVAAYIHHGAKVGVLVAVSADSADTAGSEAFTTLLKDLTLQIAAANPTVVSREELDADTVAKEREIAAEQFKDKPAQAIEKIVDGKMEKYFSEFCLVDQDFVKGDGKVKDQIAAAGEGIVVQAFLRFQVGETEE
jgi:elongation factor Ts